MLHIAYNSILCHFSEIDKFFFSNIVRIVYGNETVAIQLYVDNKKGDLSNYEKINFGFIASDGFSTISCNRRG